MKIRIPATSANLGPGFDCFGIALTLYNTFEFSFNPTAIENPKDLVYISYRMFLDKLNIAYKPMEYKVYSDIPISRGLGSSATCILAGLTAANVCCNYIMSELEILNLATEIEGHPDNIIPAYYGGFTASSFKNGILDYIDLPISKNLDFIAIVPKYPLATNVSRAVLPLNITFDDAKSNISNIPFLINGLKEGNLIQIFNNIDDLLHQPYRKKLVPEFDFFKNILAEKKIPVYLSGAGPTVMVINNNNNFVTDEIINTLLNFKKNVIIYKVSVDFTGIQIEGV